MIYLALSILTSSVILLIFKFFQKFNVDTFQAIVFNYFVAAGLGFLLFSSKLPSDYSLYNSPWIIPVLILGVLFISLFNIMGISSQKNGVAITSVTVKMSLILPVMGAVFLYDESFNFMKGFGILLALAGVFFMSYKKKTKGPKNIQGLLLVILFVGSGMLDILLNYTLNTWLNGLNEGIFTAFGFAVAGALGTIVLFLALLSRKKKFNIKNVIAGIVLGVPNFFSIYFLLMALKTSVWDDSNTFAINNTGIVLLSAIIGFIILKEQFNSKKLLGLILATSAILILANF